jgi:hypothetical protein
MHTYLYVAILIDRYIAATVEREFVMYLRNQKPPHYTVRWPRHPKCYNLNHKRRGDDKKEPSRVEVNIMF